MTAGIVLRKLSLIVLCVLFSGCVEMQRPVDIVTEPYLLDTGLVSRSICFENPTGAPGEGPREQGQPDPEESRREQEQAPGPLDHPIQLGPEPRHDHRVRVVVLESQTLPVLPVRIAVQVSWVEARGGDQRADADKGEYRAETRPGAVRSDGSASFVLDGGREIPSQCHGEMLSERL